MQLNTDRCQHQVLTFRHRIASRVPLTQWMVIRGGYS